MQDRLLVAFASGYGSTHDIAEVIGHELRQCGLTVEVRRVGEVRELSRYRAVALGASIRAGQWLFEAAEFLKCHRAALSRVPVAYFVTCMTVRDNTPKNRRAVKAYLEPIRVHVPEVNPVSVGCFAGALNYGSLSMTDKLMARLTRLPDGDFRNWQAIRDWATGLYRVLLN
ncbi:MAG: flavodoxin [Anaerolineae bacterium]|nr:flavodoxin [Anaerolineae bacterium]